MARDKAKLAALQRILFASMTAANVASMRGKSAKAGSSDRLVETPHDKRPIERRAVEVPSLVREDMRRSHRAIRPRR